MKPVFGKLDNIEMRLDSLLEEWTKSLLDTISDPIVESQKEYLSEAQQKAIDDFIETKELPKRVDDFFVKAIQALLKGFEPVVVNADDLVEKLTKLPPLDEHDLLDVLHKEPETVLSRAETIEEALGSNKEDPHANT